MHSHAELRLSNQQLSATGTSLEYRTAIASVGFSRGVHYWEVRSPLRQCIANVLKITVDRYDGHADVVVGIARKAVCKEAILGKVQPNILQTMLVLNYFFNKLSTLDILALIVELCRQRSTRLEHVRRWRTLLVSTQPDTS